MRTIWKFTLDITGHLQSVRMLAGARVVHVAMQGQQSTMWAEVDTDAAHEWRKFIVVGTGHPIPDFAGEHIATWQDGPFVWHLYTVSEGAS